MNSNAIALGRLRYALVALILCLGLSATPALSQVRVANYIVSTSTNSFTYDYGTYRGYGVNSSFNVPLPFAFTYDGVVWPANTTMQIGTGGWVRFGGGNLSSDQNVLGNSLKPNTINVLSQYLYCASAIYTTSTGSSGNRIFTIGWYYMYHYNYYNGYKMFSVKLYEADNSIEMLYSTPGSYMGPYNFGVGLNGSTNGGFSSLTYQNNNYVPSVNIKFRPPKSDKPDLNVSTSQVTFPDLPLGQTAQVCFTVSNNGTAGEAGAPANPLVFSAASILGLNSEFQLVSSPTVSLNIGESAQFCVQATPAAPGVRNSSLVIPSNASSGTKVVGLSVRGLAPLMTVNTTYLFRKTRTRMAEPRTQTFHIRNSGSAPMTVTGLTIGGEYPEQYSIVQQPLTPIAAGDSAPVSVTYTPVFEGLKTATLDITTNAFGINTHRVNLYGTGIIPRLQITPEIVQFDSIAMGDTAWTTIRLSNVGSDTLAVQADYVTYFDRDFAYFGLEGADSLIAPEKFRDVMVRFTPQSQGARQGRVRFITNIPWTFEAVRRDTSVFIVDVFGTAVPYGLISVIGPTAVDSAVIGSQVCQTVTITNNGQIPLTVQSAAISGPDAADFTLTGVTYPVTIPAASSIDVQVCGTPSSRGLRTAMVDVVSYSNEKMTTTQLPLAVYGLLQCAQSSTNVAFENEIVLVSTNSSADIMVNNCGDVATTYTATIAGAGYSLTGPAVSTVVAPGENFTYSVAFNPTTMAPLPGTLTITAPGVADMVVQLAGTGGDVNIVAANNNAPATDVGMTSEQFTVTVTNTGNMELTPGEPSVSNTEFAYVSGSGPATIAAGASGDYKFTFTPAAAGARTATVTFPAATPALTGAESSFELNGTAGSASVRPVALNGYSLGQNYPNPFASQSVITFTMAEAGNAQIIISDVTGNIVAIAANQHFNAGENTVTFDASNMASGTYFYELVANGVRVQRSMLLKK